MLMRTAELAAPVIDSLRRQRQERDRHLETILMLAKACEARDETTGQHLQRIHQLSRQLGLQMGLSVEEADRIATAAILHDIGKIRLPESILQNPGRLSDQEWEEMRKHPIYGEEILGDSLDFTLERQSVRWHHERWDGTGYPDGLKGEEIPLVARIVAVADAFEAMTSQRPYKLAWPRERAITEIWMLRNKHYDPSVVDGLLELWDAGLAGQTREAEA